MGWGISCRMRMNINDAVLADEERESCTASRIQTERVETLILPHFPNFEFFVLGYGWGAPDADAFWFNAEMAHSELKTYWLVFFNLVASERKFTYLEFYLCIQ